MPRFCVRRRVNIEEMAVFDIDVPDFLIATSDRDLYVSRFAGHSQSLTWRETVRAHVHSFHIEEVDNTTELTVVEPKPLPVIDEPMEKRPLWLALKFW